MLMGNNTMALLSLSDPKHPANIVLNTVSAQLGKGFYWQKEVTGVSTDWCAATVVAAGIYTKLSGIVFPKKGQTGIYYAGMCGKAFESFGGKRIDGPMWGYKDVKPTRGDIIVFVWKKNNESFYASVKNQTATYGRYSASHIGMVTDCRDGKVYTIEGNCGGNTDKSKNYIKERSYSINSENISFYIRPDWSRADGIVSVTTATAGTYIPTEEKVDSTYKIDGTYSTQLYTTESTKADASIREVAYLGNDGKPCINITPVMLSAVNYTGLLSGIYKLSGGTEQTTAVADNIDALPSIPRTIVEFFLNKGLNTAASIGIIANMFYESGFKTGAIGDNGTSFGLCQWHGDNGKKMRNHVGLTWAINLSGQLEFLWFDLNDRFVSQLLNPLKAVPNTEYGTKQSAELFVRQYERPANIEEAVKKRVARAVEYWKDIVATSVVSNASDTSTPTVQNAPKAEPGKLVWPLPNKAEGQYSSPFGYRGNIGINGATSYHNGVDIESPNGTPIHCCADGVINYKTFTESRGNVVVVDHGEHSSGQHFYTLYQHMKSASPLNVGTKVTANQIIGYVGNTGVGSNHLHLETQIGGKGKLDGQWYDKQYQSWRNKYCVDPAQYFRKLGSKT